MRGYDSPNLFREDTLARIEQHAVEIRDLERSMERVEEATRQAEANVLFLKNKLDIFYPPLPISPENGVVTHFQGWISGIRIKSKNSLIFRNITVYC